MIGFRNPIWNSHGEENEYSAYDDAVRGVNRSRKSIEKNDDDNIHFIPPVEWSIFKNKYDSEEKCLTFLFQFRWGTNNEWSCSKCGNHSHRPHGKRYRCTSCRYSSYIFAGTRLTGCRMKLVTLLRLCFLMAHKPNISIYEIRKMIGTGSLYTYSSSKVKLECSMIALYSYQFQSTTDHDLRFTLLLKTLMSPI